MRKLFALLLSLVSVCLLSTFVYARIGVGVGTGKIVVNDILKPGQIYTLPSLTVLNTGDVKSTYKVSITYHEQQPELMPSQDLFQFSPETFDLESGDAKVVNIKLNLPLRVEPGKYFAYLEASPVSTTETAAGTSIGVAAAAKLYFEIAPANIFQALYYKLVSLWKLYSPWSLRITIFIGLVIILLLLRKFLNINISLKKKDE
jgi:hypothetical protein